jgi:hypothetical protein
VLLREHHLNAAVLRLRPEAAPFDSRVEPLAVGEPLIGVGSLCRSPGFVAGSLG